MLAEASAKLWARFEETFGLRRSGRSEEEIIFAMASMSAMLGGLGYFYGSTQVQLADGRQNWAPPAPLFTAVPSRSFFPRGFLWDEGFHQLLIGRWDPALSKDVIAHWFGVMRKDGWIPREQIRGAEALSKVPDWAVTQHDKHANPPTFLLAIEALIEQSRAKHGPGLDPDTSTWLSAVLPSVERWFQWYQDSQAGTEANSFRWHGRNAEDGKLNAMTLSSGLDDYPRASAVASEERHVDLHSWIAFGAGVLRRIGELAGLPVEKVEAYRRLHSTLLESLDSLHWDEKRQRYSDFGLHSNKGTYEPHIVVKCADADGSNPVEHALSKDHYKELQRGSKKIRPCPITSPKFLFPLGDAQGGLMMRDKFAPKDQKLQFIHHTGYVTLFPLFLRLIRPDSARLGQTLELLGDPTKGLWSDFGLRSLAKGDTMYLRDNSPGDAPYWRGPIWINCNYLAVDALRYYASQQGPHQARAEELWKALSANLVRNVMKNFERTGFLWEQYHQDTGEGQRTHPFNGWSSLVVLMMAKE